MDKKLIRVGIVGYGNLGRAAEQVVRREKDMKLVGIFSRRCKTQQDFGVVGWRLATKYGTPVYPDEELDKDDMSGYIDVLILCGGSSDDLPNHTPHYARNYNVVDSYDCHAKIKEHFERVHDYAANNGQVAIISVGWDPGLFSLMRLYGAAFFGSMNATTTFWGTGVSQGHSNAIRQLDPIIKDAVQFTVPREEAVKQAYALRGDNPPLSGPECHRRECYVALAEGADNEATEDEIRRRIKEMPNYFADYETEVNFVSEQEVRDRRGTLPHGGLVISTGQSHPDGKLQTMEFKLDLESNSEFTACVLVAYARAAYKMHDDSNINAGAYTIFDVAPQYLLPDDYDDFTLL